MWRVHRKKPKTIARKSSHVFLLLLLAGTARASDCPKTPREWTELKESWLDAAQGVSTPPPTPSELTKKLLECVQSPAFRESAELKRCYGNILKFANGLDNYLITTTFEQYKAAAEKDFPAMMAIPDVMTSKETLESIRDGANAWPAMRALEAKLKKTNPGAKLMLYKSKHLQALDKSWGRLLVYLPGQNYDQWLQYGMPVDGEKRGDTTSISLVGVQKKNKDGSDLVKPKVFFRDHKTTPGTTAFHVANSKLDCKHCHQGGVVPIMPDALDQKHPDQIDWQATEALNQEIKKYGEVEMPHFSSDTDGPAIGPVAPDSRTDAFLKTCAVGTPTPENFRRIRKAMNCATCHSDDGEVNQLNAPLGSGNKTDLVKTAILTKHMPPADFLGSDAQLTDDERTSIYQCLHDEYYGPDESLSDSEGLLHEWLKGPDCPAGDGEKKSKGIVLERENGVETAPTVKVVTPKVSTPTKAGGSSSSASQPK